MLDCYTFETAIYKSSENYGVSTILFVEYTTDNLKCLKSLSPQNQDQKSLFIAVLARRGMMEILLPCDQTAK